MKINFVPRYGRSAASSRMRVYAIAEEIERQGLAEVSVSRDRLAWDETEDLCVIQKCDLTGAPTAPDRKVVYDYDDDLPALLRAPAQCARLITTDTNRRKNNVFPLTWEVPNSIPLAQQRRLLWWIERFPRGAVIPDCIDYAPPHFFDASEKLNTLAWFGNYGNFNCQWIFDAWPGPNLVITDRLPVGVTGAYTQWSYDSFPSVLRMAQVACLSHKGQDQSKSNNKLIAAVTFGVPCIVGEFSPEYEDLLRECELGHFIVHNKQDVRDCMRELASVAGRQAYLDKIQPLVWERYRVEVVARLAFEEYQAVAEGE